MSKSVVNGRCPVCDNQRVTVRRIMPTTLTDGSKVMWACDKCSKLHGFFHVTRTVDRIAQDIFTCWPSINPYAKEYARAMMHLTSVRDRYMSEDGDSIVLRFLDNASGWRGDAAKNIKAELNYLLDLHRTVNGRMQMHDEESAMHERKYGSMVD